MLWSPKLLADSVNSIFLLCFIIQFTKTERILWKEESSDWDSCEPLVLANVEEGFSSLYRDLDLDVHLFHL